MNLLDRKLLMGRWTGPVAKLGLAILISLLLALGLRLVGVPRQLAINEDFSYTADVISLDNFYDEASGKFTGESRSVTTFGYRWQDLVEGGVLIKNFFDVRTVRGEKIIAVDRNLGIDRLTWQHKAGLGDKDRQGYLFAPRHLTKNDSFTYWHVNYDLGLDMAYDGEETVGGIKTLRYTASFAVDQTKDLTHLPGVPEERGVNLDANLTLWVEPVSGWLVKYEDSAIAYYYDIETGERLHPWNKFSNRFRQTSIIEQAKRAKQERIGVLAGELLVPLLVFTILALAMTWSKARRLALVVLALGILATFLLLFWLYWPFFNAGKSEIRVGIARWVPLGNQAYDVNIQGFKDALAAAGYREGKDIIFDLQIAEASGERQEQIADKFSRDNVDLVFSQTTPGTLILKKLMPHRPIVFSIVTYPVEAGLIASLENSGNNLVGTRNWVSVTRQLANFLRLVPDAKRIGFLHRAGELNSEIQLAEMRAAGASLGIEIVDIAGDDVGDIENSLGRQSGEIDAVYSACDTLIQGEAEQRVIAASGQYQLPSFSCNVTGPEKGDLIGTVADFYEIGRLAGEKAALILEGVSPTALETSTVARPQIHLNSTRAEELNIVLPQDLVVEAEKVY